MLCRFVAFARKGILVKEIQKMGGNRSSSLPAGESDEEVGASKKKKAKTT